MATTCKLSKIFIHSVMESGSKQRIYKFKISLSLSVKKTPSIGAHQIEVSEIWGKALGTRIVSRNCQFLSKSQVLSVNSKFILHGDLHESISIDKLLKDN